MKLNSAAPEHGNSFELIEIRRIKSDFASNTDYLKFRNELVGKAINPWLKNEYLQGNIHEQHIPRGVWALIARDLNDESIILLDFAELDVDGISEPAESTEGLMDFSEWVAHFNPLSWGDWLMVPKLYLMHLRTGGSLSDPEFTPSPWIDALLHESRGMLMWSHQSIELIRMLTGVGRTKACKIHSSYLIRKPGWEKSFEYIYPPTTQTLLQIFEERKMNIQYLGSPDYILADWLSNNLYKVVKRSCIELLTK